MQTSSKRNVWLIALFLFGLITGLGFAYVWQSAKHTSEWFGRPVLIIATDIKDLNRKAWLSHEIRESMIPMVDLPPSAKDIMIYDHSGIDMRVFMSFEASSTDISSYVDAFVELWRDSAPAGTHWEKRKGKMPDGGPDTFTPESPSELAVDILDRYWHPYDQVDYFYSERGFYIGVHEKKHRVFVHRWTQ